MRRVDGRAGPVGKRETLPLSSGRRVFRALRIIQREHALALMSKSPEPCRSLNSVELNAAMNCCEPEPRKSITASAGLPPAPLIKVVISCAKTGESPGPEKSAFQEEERADSSVAFPLRKLGYRRVSPLFSKLISASLS